jgi:hypothetical protein
LRTGERFYGFAGNSTHQFLLVYRSVSGSVNWLDLYKRSSSVADWSAACSWLDDTNFTATLQVDSQYAWVIHGNYKYLRRFSLSTCKEEALVALPGAAISYLGFFYAFSSSRLYQAKQATSASASSLATYTLPMLIPAESYGGSTVGSFTQTWKYSFALASGAVWTMSRCSSYSEMCLWKVDLNSGAAIGWAEFPTSDHINLSVTSTDMWKAFIALENETAIWLAVSNKDQIYFYRWELSNF